MIQVDINNQMECSFIGEARLRTAAMTVLQNEKVRHGKLSLAIVDDPTIHDLNVRFLDHDYPTDVLSFLIEQKGDYLEGEVIASAQTAAVSAASYGWDPKDELLLYFIHGILHLVGYDDHRDEDREAMRAKERHYLAQLGIQVPPESRSAVERRARSESASDAGDVS